MDGHSPQVWFITGTSSGFGHRLVPSALARGDRVIATARSLEKVKGFEESDNLRLLQLDVTDSEASIKATVAEAVAIWGRIDVLVNNAGYGVCGLFEEAGVQFLKEQYNVNVFGVLTVTTAVLPYMRARRSGTIVIVGSRSAWREAPGIMPYCSSKAAVHSIGEALAAEVAQFSIRVLIVAPASFRTEGMLSYPYFTGNPIPDYDAMRNAGQKQVNSMIGKATNDPKKAVEAICDVVRGEGVAKGKEWPLYLMLGKGCEEDVRSKCTKVLSVLDEWKDVTRAMEFDEVP